MKKMMMEKKDLSWVNDRLGEILRRSVNGKRKLLKICSELHKTT